MKQHPIQHLVYGTLLVVAVVGLFLYQSYSNYQLESEIQVLSQQVQQVSQVLNENIRQLQQKSALLEEGVQSLNQSLGEKERAIADLTGEVEDVRTQSAQQADTLAKFKAENADFSDVIEQSLLSVVSVKTNSGSGSGFIIDTEGHVVTNYHVIEGASAGNVITSDGVRHRIIVVGTDPVADVAVLRISDTSYPNLRFGDSNAVRVGEKVIAIGNPGGLDFSVTQGIVSATGRTDAKENEYIQIDVAINPGNSGGPLINAAGRVIGVNTLKVSGFEGVGFALTANEVRGIVEEIIASNS